jgi:drug/metabolite transporter (DMT)-like permease
MHYFFNQAIRLTEVTFLTPFKYLGLIFASIFGFIYFGDVPSVYTWIGGTILFSSMLIITIRENQLSKDIVKKSDINNL